MVSLASGTTVGFCLLAAATQSKHDAGWGWGVVLWPVSPVFARSLRVYLVSLAGLLSLTSPSSSRSPRRASLRRLYLAAKDVDRNTQFLERERAALQRVEGERRAAGPQPVHVGPFRYTARHKMRSWDAVRLKTRVRRVLKDGVGRYCSPRHGLPFNSINEGSKCVV